MEPIDFKLTDKDFGFLSNFYYYPTQFMGIWYDTNEHLYQSLKADNYNDALYVRSARSPAQAKSRGREIQLRDDWDNVKDQVMLLSLRIKFLKGSVLAEKLELTYPFELREWAPWDSYWGLGKDLQGKNMLGKLLMQVRNELKAGQFTMFEDYIKDME